jgi:hypothetical protein
MKGSYEMPTASIVINRKWKAFLLSSDARHLSMLTMILNTALQILALAIIQDIHVRKTEVKYLSFVDHIILYVKKIPKTTIKISQKAFRNNKHIQ